MVIGLFVIGLFVIGSFVIGSTVILGHFGNGVGKRVETQRNDSRFTAGE
jgi:hypothetical protein